MFFKKKVTPHQMAEGLYYFAFRLFKDSRGVFDEIIGAGVTESVKVACEWEVNYFIFSVACIVSDLIMLKHKTAKKDEILDAYYQKYLKSLEMPIKMKQYYYDQLILRHRAYAAAWRSDDPLRNASLLLLNAISAIKRTGNSDSHVAELQVYTTMSKDHSDIHEVFDWTLDVSSQIVIVDILVNAIEKIDAVIGQFKI